MVLVGTAGQAQSGYGRGDPGVPDPANRGPEQGGAFQGIGLTQRLRQESALGTQLLHLSPCGSVQALSSRDCCFDEAGRPLLRTYVLMGKVGRWQ